MALKLKPWRKKAFQLSPNASRYIMDAFAAYEEAFKLTDNKYYINLRDTMINRVKAFIRQHGSFPGGLTLSK